MAVGPNRLQRMVESGWIIRDAIDRVMIEYELTHAELTAVLSDGLSGWTKEQLRKDWSEE